MKKLIALSLASTILTCQFAVKAEFVRIDVGESEPEIEYSATEDSGMCGDNIKWHLDSEGVLELSGTGYMYDYFDEERFSNGDRTFIPWLKNNDSRAIKEIRISDGILNLSGYVFANTNITSVILPPSVSELGNFVFGGCSKLKIAVLSDNIKEIPFRTFSGDESLSYVHMPFELESIGESAFMHCSSLSKIDIPDSVNNIGEGAFLNCMNLTEITLPSNIEEIGTTTFQACDALKNVYFPSSLKTIGWGAFADCFNITEIIIPDGTETIERVAFSFTNKTSKNQKIYIPETVKKIGLSAFNSDNTIIYGFKNSEAEKYASDNNIEFIEVTESMYIEPKNEADNNIIDVFSDGDYIGVIAGEKNVIWTDAQPFIDENGRTQIPIRVVAESLGAKVDWDVTERTATITKDDKVITIAIDNTNLQVGNKTITMDTTAQIINERKYIPIRFVGEALGMKVNWESK